LCRRAAEGILGGLFFLREWVRDRLSLMRDDGQMEMLLSRYAGMGDGELLRMAEQSEDLTDAAREALAAVMRERGLSAVREDAQPQAARQQSDQEEAPLQGVRLSGNESALWMFRDAFQASEAIRVLTEAGIWHRVADESRAAGEGMQSQVLLGLVVVVQSTDYEAAVALMREKMGLFPLAEVEGAAQSHLTGMEGTVLVSMFDREEALVVAEALGRAGISYWWRDGRQEVDELPDEETVAIEVRGERLVDAVKVVEERLG
jgi:hypothetical protein